jgi:hypothetical protein
MMIHPEVQLMLARDRSAALRAAAEAYRRGRLARSAAAAAAAAAAVDAAVDAAEYEIEIELACAQARAC